MQLMVLFDFLSCVYGSFGIHITFLTSFFVNSRCFKQILLTLIIFFPIIQTGENMSEFIRFFIAILISFFLFSCVPANESSYEIILEAASWSEAAKMAAAKGGKLAEINSEEEQKLIEDLIDETEIKLSQSRALDGGPSSYLWIGGNDLASEGQWLWNGDLDDSGLRFWTGDVDGNPENDAYTNWGYEPDNYQEQDALGLAIANWPRGMKFQWNDLDSENELFFIVEYEEGQ